jgi:hypothetical protein
MDKSALEMITTVAGLLAFGSSAGLIIGNFFDYNITSQKLNKDASTKGRNPVEESAKQEFDKIRSDSWVHRNLTNYGARIAYERFLERNS